MRLGFFFLTVIGNILNNIPLLLFTISMDALSLSSQITTPLVDPREDFLLSMLCFWNLEAYLFASSQPKNPLEKRSAALFCFCFPWVGPSLSFQRTCFRDQFIFL